MRRALLVATLAALALPASAQYFDQPTAVRTTTYRQGGLPAGFAWPGAPQWLPGRPSAPPATWRVRSDGLWVPYTLDPPAWYGAIAQAAPNAVPLPTPRPAAALAPATAATLPETQETPRRGAGGLCERHGLRKVYTDGYRWRCRL
jgi:hypothetical protein